MERGTRQATAYGILKSRKALKTAEQLNRNE